MCSPDDSDVAIELTKSLAPLNKDTRLQQGEDIDWGDLPIQAQAKKSQSSSSEKVIPIIQEAKGLCQNPVDNPALVSNLTTRLNDVVAQRRGSRSSSRSLSSRSAEGEGPGFMTGSVSPVCPSSPSDIGETYISSPADEPEAFGGKRSLVSQPARTATLPPTTNPSILSVANTEVVSGGATEACSEAASKYGSGSKDAHPTYTEPEFHDHSHCVESPRAREKTEVNATTHSRGLKNPFSRRVSPPNSSARPLKDEVHSSRDLEESGLSAKPGSSTGLNTPAHIYQRGRTHSTMSLFSQASSAVQSLRRDRRSPAIPPLQSGAGNLVEHNVVTLPMHSPAETGRIARQRTDTGVSSTLIDEAE
jgi:hypothetical protein